MAIKMAKLWAKLYRQETGFYLNYLTLQVKDPALKQALNDYRTSQWTRVQYAVLISISISLCLTLFKLVVEDAGHPMLLITNFLSACIISMMIILTKCDKPHYNQLLTSAYIWVHIIATCCVYNDLAPSLLTGNKHEFEY